MPTRQGSADRYRELVIPTAEQFRADLEPLLLREGGYPAIDEPLSSRTG
jgi:hypothetical protein